MKTILVNTSHNIAIRYELASVMHRAGACLIDLVIMALYMITVAQFIGDLGTVFSYFAYLLLPGFYHLISEVFLNGQSPGKKILSIRVITLSGKKPSIEDYFLRWIFRTIEILGSGGALAAINIASTEKNQRIGDILAGTTVIKVIPENAVSLDTLKSLADKKREITYSGVTIYNDQDMLLVKDAIHRYRIQPNEANKKLILELSKRISDDLNVTYKGRATDFLETALVDYIFLTR